MKIKISRKQIVSRAVACFVALAVVVGAVAQLPRHAEAADRLNKVYQFKDTNYAVPTSKVLWVATDGDDNAAGTERAPLRNISTAVKKASSGYTIVVKRGIYRDQHFFVENTKTNITIQAAPHAEVWLKGSDVIEASRWQKEGNIWKVKGNFHNMCQVCTVNKNPKIEGMAAYPEQVFINDKPLTQVASKDDVKAGTFYVEDKTPITMKTPGNNKGGLLNVENQDEITYYVGSDPTAGVTEISERPRAFTAVGANFAWKGINVAHYSHVQEWGFDSKKYPGINGTAASSVNGNNSVVQDSIFAQNSVSGLILDKPENARVVGNTFIDNGGNGTGANRAHGSTYEANTFTNNNAAGFETRGSVCKEYCTVSDIKVTHVENFSFRNNIVDYSSVGRVSSEAEVAHAHRTPAFWCDEGCINTTVVGNFFTNAPHAIFYEVSGSGIIASNVIESGGRGIGISSSENVKIYNNTISRTFLPFEYYEDQRTNGCNYYKDGACVTYEPWSQEKGLKWDLSNIEMYNNIISSRSWRPNDGSDPYYSYPVRATGAVNYDGTVVVTNDMFKGFDYNVYYRSSESNEPHMFTWDFPGGFSVDHTFKRASEISQDVRVRSSIDGREAHALDTFGSRENNPYFVKEASGNGDFKKSNYNIKAGSPALNSGKPLPADVAKAIDPSGATVKAGVAVNRGALMNAMMDATGGETPTPPTPTPVVVNVPDANLKTAINKRLAVQTGVARADNQDISKDDMAKLTQLNISALESTPDSAKVANLTGLEEAANLTALYADNNAIASLAPLSNLKKLENLSVGNNKITDIAPLAGTTALKVLVANNGNTIETLAPLKNLANLTTVSLSGGNATDIDFSMLEASAANLTRFSFYDRAFKASAKNIASLKKFTKLETLRLTGVPLEANDVKNIGAVTSLTTLRVDFSTIADLSPLKNLTNLTRLEVANQRVSARTTSATFPSPLKDPNGAVVAITDGASLVNDGDNPGAIKVANPIYDGAERTLRENWNANVTIGHVTAPFSGELTVRAAIPKADLNALKAAVAVADGKPDYIKNDAAVRAALEAARVVIAKPAPTPAEIASAETVLRQAVAAAEQKESNAKAAAETAVAAAENSKDPDDVAAAEAKVALVQDPADNKSFTDRLKAVAAAIKTARDALTAVIDKASAPGITDGMTADTAQALRDQLAIARAVAADSGASVSQLDSTRGALQAKLDALRADKSALGAEVAAAENEPDYIKNDSAVKAALSAAKAVQSEANPAVEKVKKAVDNLKAAVNQAKQRETDAQTAAEAAVQRAETIKTAAEVASAQSFVDLVKDPAVKAQLQARLDAIDTTVTPPMPPVQPVAKRTITQQNGSKLTVATSGDKCYNLRDASTANVPQSFGGRVLREVAAFTIDCSHSAPAVGYSTQVVLTLAAKYQNLSNLRVAKVQNGASEDITDKVSITRAADGSVVISYRVTDGGFGDEDGVANGLIVDPVVVYEHNPAQPGQPGGSSGGISGGVAAAAGGVARAAGGLLADTGDSWLVALALGAITLGSGAAIVVVRRR